MDDHGIYPLGSMHGPLVIDPPPANGRCQACGKHFSELLPYGGPGDPLRGDFGGAKLIRVFRADWKPSETEAEIEEISKRVRQAEPGLTEEEYKNAVDEIASGGSVGAIWLCRDCVLLDEEQIDAVYKRRSDVIEHKRIDEELEKEVTGLLLKMPRPDPTIGDPMSERWTPIGPYAHHNGDDEYYTYHLNEEVWNDQIRLLQTEGWELLWVGLDRTVFGGRPTGKLVIRLHRKKESGRAAGLE